MKKYILIISLILLASCNSTKIDLRKVSLTDTNITFKKYIFNNDTYNFNDAYRAFHPEEAYQFAKTESQKTAAQALNYISQSKYEEAAETFSKIIRVEDSLKSLWHNFPYFYHYLITQDWENLEEAYSWEKPEEYEYNRKVMIHNRLLPFYKDKPKFNIDFLEDSVVIPIKLNMDLPTIKIKINGKYYTFLIDTGFGVTLIGKKLATENNTIYENKEIALDGASGGEVIVFNGLMPELDLGQIKISNFPIGVREEKDAIRAKFLFITYFQLDGIIGWDLLSKFDFTIDYKNEQLILRKPIEKNVAQRNLFWYEIPIVKFYLEGYPLLFFFDTGGQVTFFSNRLISQILEIDTNNLKKGSIKLYDAANKSAKTYYYKYPNFQCYTIANNEISYLTANKALLEENWQRYTENYPIILEGTLGSDWFKDKAIRVDMANGLFEISE